MPVAQRWAYLDHAAVAPLPMDAASAMRTWLDESVQDGDTAWPSWHRQVEATRATAATMIGAATEEVALVPSTTAGITLVSEGFPWKAGDNVVILDNEFPSNQYPWMHLGTRGVDVRRVPVDRGMVSLADILTHCDARTRIVALSWIGFASGFRLNLEECVTAIHAAGALVFLDAIQGLGVFPLDVGQLPIDFLAADGHKWMLGPEGAGIAYIREAHRDLLRPIGVGWNSVKHCYDFDHIRFDLKQSAARFEGGTLNTAGFLGLGASLRLLQGLGLTATQSPLATRVLTLAQSARERLLAAGAEIMSSTTGPHVSGIVSFRMAGVDLAAKRKRCLEAGVVVSFRNQCLRISVHAYNNEEDLDRLLDVLTS